jgi:thymidylate kinase
LGTRYICLEGTEGVGKTTQTKKLVEYLKSKGHSVLETKEPGTVHSPLTMTLRGIMLDNQYDKDLTMAGREFISQAIRSIHLERVIKPALDAGVDFIIQDRGILSGMAYGTGCGNPPQFLAGLSQYVVATSGIGAVHPGHLYNDVVVLTGNVGANTERALASKKEFETGDAMESRGNDFLTQVSDNMRDMSVMFNSKTVNVDGKSIDEVFADILTALNLN